MPNQRIFLWLAFLFLVWLNVDAWMKDYGSAAQPAAAPATTQAPAATAASGLTDALPTVAGEPACTVTGAVTVW